MAVISIHSQNTDCMQLDPGGSRYFDKILHRWEFSSTPAREGRLQWRYGIMWADSGMERYGASIYFDFFYVCSSFIFVSLKTFHEELKTSSFVFLPPVSCSSAQLRSCYNKNVCGDEDLHFEIVDCSPVATVQHNLYWSPRRISS